MGYYLTNIGAYKCVCKFSLFINLARHEPHFRGFFVWFLFIKHRANKLASTALYTLNFTGVIIRIIIMSTS